ncbi:hypothetical protein ACVDG5_035305 [Mesorhizobium sp. ORM6]
MLDQFVREVDFDEATYLVSKGATPPRRVLLTTMREIERIGPALASLDDFLALDAPDYLIGDPEVEQAHSVPGSEADGAYDEEEEDWPRPSCAGRARWAGTLSIDGDEAPISIPMDHLPRKAISCSKSPPSTASSKHGCGARLTAADDWLH